MARPPASPVAVQAGIAYVLTNAGALASVDAYTGSLRWIRRYERTHPFRPKAVRRSRPRTQQVFQGRFFQEIPLDGFAPGEIVVHDGLVIFAPCDGRVMHCLDGASGEPVWMLSKDSMEYLLGSDDEHLYVAGIDSVYTIGLRTGVRLWTDDMPDAGGAFRWRGRGTVAGDLMILPGSRELLLRKVVPTASWIRVPLPSFSYGHDPLSGPFNVEVDGSYIAAVYQGGIEMYSTIEALTALADASEDLLQRSVYQAQAGELMASIATLEAIDAGSDERLAAEVPKRMLSLCGEMAVVMATRGARKEALELLDRCRARLTNRRQIERWHLARLEVFKALGDAVAIEHEQEALYKVMEGG